jgi:hypothetical protein
MLRELGGSYVASTLQRVTGRSDYVPVMDAPCVVGTSTREQVWMTRNMAERMVGVRFESGKAE